jgi:hypothetical protein
MIRPLANNHRLREIFMKVDRPEVLDAAIRREDGLMNCEKGNNTWVACVIRRDAALWR